MPYMIGVDQGVNLKKLRQLQAAGIVVLHQAHDLEQQFRRVTQQGRPFQLGLSTLDGPDMLADEKLHDVFRELGKGREVDAEHLYACYLNRNDYFLTENPEDFINGGRRERLEALLGEGSAGLRSSSTSFGSPGSTSSEKRPRPAPGSCPLDTCIGLAVPGRPIRSLAAEDRSAGGVRDHTAPDPDAHEIAHGTRRDTPR